MSWYTCNTYCIRVVIDLFIITVRIPKSMYKKLTYRGKTALSDGLAKDVISGWHLWWFLDRHGQDRGGRGGRALTWHGGGRGAVTLLLRIWRHRHHRHWQSWRPLKHRASSGYSIYNSTNRLSCQSISVGLK